MMPTWMLYAVALSALLGLAAAALERILLARGAATRWVWVLALAGSVLLPLLAGSPAPAGPRATASGAGVDLGAIETLSAAGVAAHTGGGGVGRLDRALAAGWAAASLGLLCVFGFSALTLRRLRRGWRRGRIDGERVLVSERTGPAIVGFLRCEIVIPAWVLEWEEPKQRLLLDHEREHLYAGDPRLRLGALAALVLAPWNPALWWQVRRLRLAVEVDCDARVLDRPRDPRSYGLLLLETGSRAGPSRLAAAAFSEPGSSLERRIRILAGPRPRLRRRLLLGLAAGAALAPLTLFAFPTPARPELDRILAPDRDPPPAAADPGRDTAAGPDPAFAPFDVPPRLRTGRREVVRVLDGVYPRVLRSSGVGGTVLLWALVDESGAVADERVAEGSGHRPLDEAARRAVREFRFTPARLRGEPVALWIRLPVTFRPDDAVEGAASVPIWTRPVPRDSLRERKPQ